MSHISFLHARDMSKSYGDRLVLVGVSIVASPGERLGLVGENGVGKSTLLRLLAGVEPADSGEIVRPDDIGFLEQEIPLGSGLTVGTFVDAALADVRGAEFRLDALASALQRHPEDAELLAEYGAALEWAEAHEVWDADRRADRVMAGLGLGDVDRGRGMDTLSGGERSRLGLAALLLRQPGALLLDEPTNHLDDDAIGFLEDHLRNLPGVVVVASHDRVFLDAVCTDLCDLDPARAGITRYGGAYTDYLHAKRAERLRWEQQWHEEQDELAALRLAMGTTARQVSHFRPMKDRNKPAYFRHGTRVLRAVSRRVRNAEQRWEVLNREQVAKPPAQLQFSGLAAAPTEESEVDGPLASLRSVRVPGRLYVDELDVPAGARLLVTGPNGAGKSTLLSVLHGRLRAEGDLRRRPRLRVGMLDQDVGFDDPAESAARIYAGVLGPRAEEIPLASLGLLAPVDLDKPVGRLSVGQRRRLALALLVADPPELLLLDEPTNHISLALAEELEEALRSAPGAVVAASHDRWLRRNWQGLEVRITAEHRLASGSQCRAA